MKKYDIIIIGSGLGGLTAGAELASTGQHVLVLEQHYQVGGSATSFKRKGFIYEAGLHMTGRVDKGSDQYAFFKKCGLLDKVRFIPAPEFYYLKGYDYDFNFGNDLEDNIQRLNEMFPDEIWGIKKYFKTIFAIHDQAMEISKKEGLKRFFALMFSPFRYPKVLSSMFQNIGKFLDKIIKDERLKTILLANIGYYGDNPYTLSFLFYAIAQTGFYRKGGSYIQGGSHHLPYALADYIKKNNGDVLTSMQVTHIITQDSEAVGVEYVPKKQKDHSIAPESAYASIIIANTAIPNVANELLNEKDALPLKKKFGKMTIAPSIMTVYIALDKPLKEMGNTRYSSNYYDAKDFSIKDMASLNRSDFYTRPYILCDYSQIDSQLTPKEQGYVVLSMMDYYKDWKDLSDEEYKRKKERASAIMIDRVCENFPEMRDHIIRVEVATAKTMKRYLQTPEGTAYGFDQTPNQAILFRPGVRSPIKNLFFASAWTLPGAGFGGAMSSGHICAAEIKKDLGITK